MMLLSFFIFLGAMLDTVRNPLLHRDRMTSLQSKSAAKDYDARKVLGDKYDAMDKAKNETYRELGTAMYEGGHHRDRQGLGSGGGNENVGDAHFLPAWMLLDESKEDAGRIDRRGQSNRSGHSAGIIIVGDEIVSGIKEDDYSHFVGVALRRQYGVTVTQVMKIVV